MDKVRLGRALGYGTRHAAKTLAAAAEAAAAPDPRRRTDAQSRPANLSDVSPDAPPRMLDRQEQPVNPHGAQRAVRPGRVAARVPSTAQVGRVGRSMWGSLATFSGALWLRVTGTFFGLIAFAMANGAWRLQGAVRGGAASSTDVRHFWLFVAFAVLFGYFAVSSFVRANLRERRGGATR